MTRPAAPLNALVAVLAMWVAGRAGWVLWRAPGTPNAHATPVDRTLADAPPNAESERNLTRVNTSRDPLTRPVSSVRTARTARYREVARPDVSFRSATHVPYAGSPAVTRREEAAPPADIPNFADKPSPTAPAYVPPRARSPLFGSAWVALRAPTPGGAPRLGDSQAGARVWLPVRGPLHATARVSAAPGSRQFELAPGVALRARDAGVIAELRLDPDRAPGAALIGFAGRQGRVGPMEVEGYAQGGLVLNGRATGVGDAQLAARLPVGGRLSLGAAAGGAFQGRLARIDVGPDLTWRTGRIRVSGGWRWRIAGGAGRASGPSAQIAADF